MKTNLTTKQKVVRSIVWLGAGATVLVVRGSLFPDAYSPFWVAISGAMIAYGATSLAWHLLRTKA